MNQAPPLVYHVGIVGNHNSGKSTGANRLAEALVGNPRMAVIRLNFADALRDYLGSILPDRPSDIKGHVFEREALLYVGEKWRDVDRNHWLKLGLAHIQNTVNDIRNSENPPQVVCTISADPYHFNELTLMDYVVAVRNLNTPPLTEAQLMRKEYWPVTQVETEHILSRVEILNWLFPKLIFQEVDKPHNFSDPQNIEWLKDEILADINKRLRHLGRPTLE